MPKHALILEGSSGGKHKLAVDHPFSDMFNRADNAASVDNGWVVRMRQSAHVTPLWGIAGNTAYCSATPTYMGGLNEALLLRETPSGDFDMTFTLGAYTSGSFTAIVAAFRADPAQDDGEDGLGYYALTRTQLVEIQSGFGGGFTAGSFSLVSGDVVRIRAVGPSIKVFQNGTLVVDVARTYNQTAGSHGLASYDASWDHFTFDSFTITGASLGGQHDFYVEPTVVDVTKTGVDVLIRGTQARVTKTGVDVLIRGTQARVTKTGVDVLLKP